jgi:hypothetical protein
MGAKTFINNSSYTLSVMLTVRQGDQPGHVFSVNSFSIGPNGTLAVQYSGDNNPYLDGISVNAVGNGNIITSQNSVNTRGSAVDNALNTNNTVSFAIQNTSILIGFSNS